MVQNILLTNQDMFNAALKYFSGGDSKNAEMLCRKILGNEPNNIASLSLLGTISINSGDFTNAEQLFSKAISYENKNSQMYTYLCSSLANVYTKQARTGDAIFLYKKAIASLEEIGQRSPGNASMFIQLANLLREKGEIQEAIATLEKLIQFSPADAKAHHLLGLLYNDAGNIDKAIYYCDLSYSLDPKNPQPLLVVAKILKSINQRTKAKEYLIKILQQHPQSDAAYLRLADIEFETGHIETAISHYKNALSINPNNEGALGSLFSTLVHVCAWDEVSALKDRVEAINIKALSEGRPTYTTPLDDVMHYIDPARNLIFSQAHAKKIERKVNPLELHFSFEERKSKKKKLTIGYISGDFRNHPLFHLTNNMFKYHDREKFHVIAYSLIKDENIIYSKKIEDGCDDFVDISAMNNQDAATRIYEDGVDILVDLTGYTATARSEISALRPAPVQMHYLGFIGSSGANWYDYIITDKIATPLDFEKHYTEKFLYMPDCYQVNDNEAIISDKSFTRSDFGLPEQGFVFCCFNQAVKIEPVMFSAWVEILKRCPDSVLWLRGKNTAAEKNLRCEAKKSGINPERLIFADGSLEYSEYLKRSSYADIALDTRIYNGGTITSNMLWAGVPVITLIGGHFASRMAASIINAVGLKECITHNLKEYEDLAVELATNPEKYRALRDKLKQNIHTTPLFNTKEFVSNLDNAYLLAWENFVDGNAPRHLSVTHPVNAKETSPQN